MKPWDSVELVYQQIVIVKKKWTATSLAVQQSGRPDFTDRVIEVIHLKNPPISLLNILQEALMTVSHFSQFLAMCTPVQSHEFSIYNGSRTEWSPIQSVIIQVITKLDDCKAGVQFVNYEYDYRPNRTRRRPITN